VAGLSSRPKRSEVEGPAVAAGEPLLILSIRIATLPESNRSTLVIPTGA
jgi:hypothetical protein